MHRGRTSSPTSPASRLRAPRWAPLALAGILVATLPALLIVRAAQASAEHVGLIAGASVAIAALLVTWSVAHADRTFTEHADRRGFRRAVLRMCVATLVLLLLPLGGLTYLAVREANHTVQTEVARRLDVSADASVAYLDDKLAGLKALAASYAERRLLAGELTRPGGPTAAGLQRHVAGLAAQDDSFLGAWVLDSSGVLLTFDPIEQAGDVIGRSFADRDYFRGAVRARAPYVSEAFVTALPGNPRAVAVSAPVIADGAVVGVITLGYRLETLAAYTGRLSAAQQVQLQIVDRRGTLLNAASGLPSANGDEHVAAALDGRDGHGRAAVDGVEHLVTYRPMPHVGWAVLAQAPADEAYAGARRFAGRIMAVATLLAQVMLVALLLAIRAEQRRRATELLVAKREAHLSGTLEAAGDAFLSLDASGRISRWNGQAVAAFGWTAAEAIGRRPDDLFSAPDDGLAALLTGPAANLHAGEDLAALLTGPAASLHAGRVESRARRRDGEVFAVEVSVWSSADDGSRHAFVRDITERLNAQTAVATARDEAVAASRMKSEFVANMSHEIRTPMNGVIGLTSLLLETELDDRQRDYLTTVQNSADALLNVINDILDFSKIEAGKLDIDPVDFDPRAVVEDVVSLLAAPAQAKNLEIAAVVSPALPPALHGDANRIRQVLTNLAANAVKFTERGEVVVEVAVGDPTADGTRTVTLCVTDTGIGIPADRLADLFDAFTQADTSTTRRYGGTGLGLTISRQLVQLMGGAIDVASEPGRGSRFTVTLPLPEAVAELPVPIADTTAFAGVPVLVVDDNATNRTVLTDLLAGWGIRPQSAADADEALRLLRTAAAQGRPFPVALLDMHMPGMDGLDLARAIMADADLAGIRLAMLTSTALAGEVQASRECGIAVHLTKPVRAAQLWTTLSQLIGPDPATGAAVATDDATPAPGGRILVAEDNEVNQQVTGEMLASLGYHVDIAADGAAALRMLQEQPYDAVLMDCQMPVLDGYAATRRLRELPAPLSRTPVIALTASALVSDQQRCRDAGMDEFLSKPLRKQDLDAMLRQVLTGTRAAAPSAPARPPTAAADTSPLLDADALDELRDLGPALTERFLPNFVDNSRSAAAAIAVAAARRDLTELARLAHKLRGSSGTFGARQLVRTCADLEAAARREDAAAAEALAGAVAEQTEATCAALTAEFTGSP